MANGPTIWDVDEAIVMDLLITDPSTSIGLTGQTAFITLKIRRSSDSKYWTGAAWSSTVSSVSVTETDAVNEPGRYTYTLSAAANSQADKYFFHARISNAPTIEGDDIELHVSKSQTVNVYESEAD